MNLGRKTTWFENLSISSIGVLVEDSDFDENNIDAVVGKIVDNLDYYIRLNDENSDPFKEQPQAARLLYSFLEIAPILGRDQLNISKETFSHSKNISANLCYAILWSHLSWYKNVSKTFIDLILGITSNPCYIESCEDISNKCQNVFKDRGWTGPLADPVLIVLTNKFSELCRKIEENDPHLAHEALNDIYETSMQQFRAIKHLWLKAVLAKFKIFAQVFLTTFDSATQTFVPLVKLSRPCKENISTFIKGTLKTLFDALKRKSTLFFNGSGKAAKPKHQVNWIQGL